MKKFFGFLGRHLKAVLIVMVVIIAIIMIIKFKPFSGLNGGSNNTVVGTTGIVTMDGNKIGVFDTQSEAESNKISADSGVRKLQVSGSGNVDVSANVGGIPTGIISGKNGKYDMDLSGIGNGTTVVVTVSIGGDGSFFGRTLTTDVSKYYFAVNVINNEETVNTTQTLNAPNGTIKFGDDVYQTYGSEQEAQMAVLGQKNLYTLPTYMVKEGIQLHCEPGENTARIWVKPTMVDGESGSYNGVRLNQDSDWSGILYVSDFSGHQVTLMIKAENNTGLSNGYSYVSFFVPEFEAPAEEYIPPVVVID